MKNLFEYDHVMDPLLNKYNPKNQQYRNNFAEKLKILRKNRDNAQKKGNGGKANLADNISRGLTNTNTKYDKNALLLAKTNFPQYRKILNNTGKLKNNAIPLTYFAPQKMVIPRETLEPLKDDVKLLRVGAKVHTNYNIPRLEQEKNGYINSNDIENFQNQDKIFGKVNVDDKLLDLLKHRRQIASTVRRPSIGTDYLHQSRRQQYFYQNLNKVKNEGLNLRYLNREAQQRINDQNTI